MNNKGFAITTILYGTLILFLMLIVSMLGILATYKDRLSMLIDSNNGARCIVNDNCDELPVPDTPEVPEDPDDTDIPDVPNATGGEEYKILYKRNDGSGDEFEVTCVAGDDCKISSGIIRYGYKFDSWNTKSDGSGVSYSPNTNYTGGIGLTLYAKWNPGYYKIIYNLKGGELANRPSPVKYWEWVEIDEPSKNVKISIHPNGTDAIIDGEQKKENYDINIPLTFLGWTIENEGSLNTAWYKLNDGSTCYWKYEESKYNGRDCVSSTTPIVIESFRSLAFVDSEETLIANWGFEGDIRVPTISKEGHSCKWRLGTAGNYYDSGQILISDPQNINNSITRHLYAICEPN